MKVGDEVRESLVLQCDLPGRTRYVQDGLEKEKKIDGIK